MVGLKNKLPISAGILAWHSGVLKNTLTSYQKNGLFNIIDDFIIFFQEVTSEDKQLANDFNLPYIGLDKNVGIAKAFSMIAEQADHPNLLLLEHDWELIENEEITRARLSDGVNLLINGVDVIRYRHRKHPGYPLYTKYVCPGRELEHYDEVTQLKGVHLLDCIHWLENPDQSFPKQIIKKNNYFITTSRWANWTNNPCLHKRDFIKDKVSEVADSGSILLEPEISYWWSRQDYNVAVGEGLFKTYNFEKFGDTLD